MRIFQYISLCIIFLFLCSCQFSNSGDTQIRQNKLVVSQSSTFPYKKNQTNVISLLLTNNTNEEFTFFDAQLDDHFEDKQININNLLDINECRIIQSHKNCIFNFKFPKITEDSGLIKFSLFYRNKVGHTYKVDKIIYFDTAIKANNGVNVSDINTYDIVENADNWSLVIPYRITKNIKKINMRVNDNLLDTKNIICVKDAENNSESICSAIIPISGKKQNIDIMLQTENINGNKKNITVQFAVQYMNKPYLIYLNAPVMLSNEKTEVTVTVYNIGTENAEIKNVTLENNTHGISIINDCGTILEHNSSCAITYKLTNLIQDETIVIPGIQKISYSGISAKDAIVNDEYHIYTLSIIPFSVEEIALKNYDTVTILSDTETPTIDFAHPVFQIKFTAKKANISKIYLNSNNEQIPLEFLRYDDDNGFYEYVLPNNFNLKNSNYEFKIIATNNNAQINAQRHFIVSIPNKLMSLTVNNADLLSSRTPIITESNVKIYAEVTGNITSNNFYIIYNGMGIKYPLEKDQFDKYLKYINPMTIIKVDDSKVTCNNTINNTQLCILNLGNSFDELHQLFSGDYTVYIAGYEYNFKLSDLTVDVELLNKEFTHKLIYINRMEKSGGTPRFLRPNSTNAAVTIGFGQQHDTCKANFKFKQDCYIEVPRKTFKQPIAITLLMEFPHQSTGNYHARFPYFRVDYATKFEKPELKLERLALLYGGTIDLLNSTSTNPITIQTIPAFVFNFNQQVLISDLRVNIKVESDDYTANKLVDIVEQNNQFEMLEFPNEFKDKFGKYTFTLYVRKLDANDSEKNDPNELSQFEEFKTIHFNYERLTPQ